MFVPYTWDGSQFYRSATSSLQSRTKKKLLGKANWYKNKRKAEGQADGMTKPTNSSRGNQGGKIQTDQNGIL